MQLAVGIGFILVTLVVLFFMLRGDRSVPDDPTSNLPPRAPAPAPRRSVAVFARGLVLSANASSRGVRQSGQSYELRRAVVDVEIPGREPYVVEVTLRFPRGLVRAAPGDALDLSVDSGDPRSMVVLGPGGFTGPWLRTAQSFVAAAARRRS